MAVIIPLFLCNCHNLILTFIAISIDYLKASPFIFLLINQTFRFYLRIDWFHPQFLLRRLHRFMSINWLRNSLQRKWHFLYFKHNRLLHLKPNIPNNLINIILSMLNNILHTRMQLLTLHNILLDLFQRYHLPIFLIIRLDSHLPLILIFISKPVILGYQFVYIPVYASLVY